MNRPDTKDLGEFRYAIALYVKLLIRARLKIDPAFLSVSDLKAWNLSGIEKDTYSQAELLDQAAAALRVLNTQFIPRCGSGGFLQTDLSTPVGRLIELVVNLVPSEGGGPDHNQTLVKAAMEVRDGTVNNWISLIAWETLNDIRSDLNHLPHPRKPTERDDLNLRDVLISLTDTLSRIGPTPGVQSPAAEALSKEDAAKFLGVLSSNTNVGEKQEVGKTLSYSGIKDKKSGRPRLGEGPNATKQEKALRNAYDQIRPIRKSGAGPKEIFSHFQNNRQFKELVAEAGRKFDEKFARAAIAWIVGNPIDQEI